MDDPNRLIALFHSPGTGRRFWAQQARLVVEAAAAGHPESQALLDQAGEDLSALALQVSVTQVAIDSSTPPIGQVYGSACAQSAAGAICASLIITQYCSCV